MKIIIAYLSDSNDTREYSTSILPSGVFTLGARLQHAGHDVTIANFSHIGIKRAVKAIADRSPDIIAFSLLTHNRDDTIKLAHELKKEHPGIIIALGGPHASGLADEIAERYPKIDHIIRGEGENPLVALAEKITRGEKPSRIAGQKTGAESARRTPASFFSGELTGINPHEQFKFITPPHICMRRPASSPRTCAPAVITSTGVEDVIREVVTFRSRYGIVYFSFRDECFAEDGAAMKDFCAHIIEQKLDIMWNCQAFPGSLDAETLRTMKSAGCERIILSAESGSDRMLILNETGTTAGEIAHTAELIRKTGLYLTIFLNTAMRGETRADVRKTAALIRHCLPGDGIVAPAVYYPGTAGFERAMRDGIIDGNWVFNRKDRGLYQRDEPETRTWADELRMAISQVKKKAWYRAKDFSLHRAFAGDMWTTDLLEGDFYFDNEEYRLAENRYMRVISLMPESIWGYMRMGKLSFRMGHFESAEVHFKKMIELVPQYYGGWLKLAEARIAQGKKKEGKDAATRALDLNPWDIRIINIQKAF